MAPTDIANVMSITIPRTRPSVKSVDDTMRFRMRLGARHMMEKATATAPAATIAIDAKAYAPRSFFDTIDLQARMYDKERKEW